MTTLYDVIKEVRRAVNKAKANGKDPRDIVIKDVTLEEDSPRDTIYLFDNEAYLYL